MPLSETSLSSLRTLARQFADHENHDLVSDSELNGYINLGLKQLYNKFVECHGQEFFLKAFEIQLEGDKVVYELPDDLVGVKGVDWSTSQPPTNVASFTSDGAEPIPTTVTTSYDIPVEIQRDAVELQPYGFQDRHQGDYFRTSNQYRSGGAPQYRVLASQKTVVTAGDDGESTTVSRVNLIRLSHATDGYLLVWYWPEVPELSLDTDSMPTFHGFKEYPALIAAIMMLAKEESDTTALQIRKGEVEKYIMNVAASRDIGNPDCVSDVESYW